MSVTGDAPIDRRDKRKQAADEGKVRDATWRGFVNVDLTAGQKSQFEDWVKTGEAWDILDAVVRSGASVGIKRDNGSGGFMASITQRNPDSVNAGLCVTARSSEVGKALFRCLFLVAVVGVEADWTAGRPVADPDRW